MGNPHFREPLALGLKPELLVKSDHHFPRVENKFGDSLLPCRGLGDSHQIRTDASPLMFCTHRELSDLPNAIRLPLRPREQPTDNLPSDYRDKMAIVFLLFEIRVAVLQSQRLA